MLKRSQPHVRGVSAFTLLEALVVIVLLGIVASMTMPVILNIGQRAAEQEAKNIRALLTVAADKAGVMHQPVAVDFAEATTGANGHGARLTIWTQKEDTKLGVEATGSARVKWEEDGLSEMVELSRLRVLQALQDGSVMPGGKWRVTFIPGRPRPSLELKLEPISSRDGTPWTVALKPDDTSATLTAGNDAKSATVGSSRTVDLDDSGQGDSKW